MRGLALLIPGKIFKRFPDTVMLQGACLGEAACARSPIVILVANLFSQLFYRMDKTLALQGLRFAALP